MSNNNNDLVTIIVPAYNAEMFLKENIESILGQTYKKLEVIYVCDGCTDCTVDILAGYEGDSRLKIHVETENHGAAISRNIGMDMAHGDWIIFLDADDLFEPDMIEKMVRRAVRVNADMCCCYWERFEDIPNKNSHADNDMGKLYCDTYPIIELEKEERHIIQIIHKSAWTKLVHKSIYKKKEVYFQDIPNANDIYYAMVATIESKRIVYIDKVFVHYRSNKTRKTLTALRYSKKNYFFEACDKVYEYIDKKEKNLYLKRSFYNDIIFNTFAYAEKEENDYACDILRQEYWEKWGMADQDILEGLSPINKILYKKMLSNDREIHWEKIYMQARVEFVHEVSIRGCSVWGTGLMGMELLEQLSQTDIKIDHVFDSASDKWGKKIYKYDIEKFDVIGVENIIVTTSKYYEEIREQIGDRAKNIYNLEQQIWRIPSQMGVG